jgi:hypothetical protein
VRRIVDESGTNKMYKNDNVIETIVITEDFWLSFIEEGVLNPKYEGYVGGRVEVYDNKSEWAIEEIRFWTKDKGWYKFREKWDFRGVTKRQLDRLRATIKRKYYDNGDNSDSTQAEISD